MPDFTRDEVIATARQCYGKPICIDSIDEAMQQDTLGEAVMLILLETAMWDSPAGDPFYNSIQESK
jgi:hypothetical protein